MKNFLTIVLLSICGNAVGQSNSQFKYPIDRNHYTFSSSADFDGSKFHAWAAFLNTEFFVKANFFNSEFDSIVKFDFSKFHFEAAFSLTEFHSEANFNFIKFHSIAEFGETKFHSSASFSGTKFHSEATFYESAFNSLADFSETIFDSLANFSEVYFSSYADFRYAEFNSHSTFKGAILPDLLNFSQVSKINYEIDFTTTILDSTKKANNQNYKCQINIAGSDINKIKINYELFHLYFDEGTSKEIKISTYEKLLQKFKEDGFLESYKSLDLEYQDYINKENGDNFLNWFQKWWWNYRYNKEWVLYWSLTFLGVFTFINIFLFEFLQKNVYSINFKFFERIEYNRLKRNSKLEKQRKKNVFFSVIAMFRIAWNYFLFKVVNSFMYTSILFFGLKVSLENFKKFSGLIIYVWFIYLLGIFCLAYIFNIIIVK